MKSGGESGIRTTNLAARISLKPPTNTVTYVAETNFGAIDELRTPLRGFPWRPGAKVGDRIQESAYIRKA
jgi:hypothetical protein